MSFSRIAIFRFGFISVIFVVILFSTLSDARGGRRGGKGKGKSNLQFAQVAEFSLIQTQLADNRVRGIFKKVVIKIFKSAHIITGSHFSQIFRLGYKLIIICRARGEPRPMIKWFKEGAEMQPKPNVHVNPYNALKKHEFSIMRNRLGQMKSGVN